MFGLKLTPALTFVLHSLLSIFIGGLASTLIFVGQNAFTGKGNLETVLSAGLVGFGVYFTTNINKLWAAPQTAQAALDMGNDLKDGFNNLASSHQQLAAFIHASTQQNAQQTAAIQQQVAALVSTPVQPAPQASVPQRPAYTVPPQMPLPAATFPVSMQMPAITTATATPTFQQ